MNKKTFIKDYCLNLIASFLPLFVLQFLVQPFIAKQLSSEVFGLMITLTGILNMAKGIFGNTLNNIRQLKDKQYEDNKLQGDFQPLLIVNLICSFIFMAVFVYIYEPKYSLYSIFLLCITAVLWVASEYLRVSFSLVLNFRKMLINSIALSFGYFVGLVLYNIFGLWEYVFLFGGVFQLIYILYTSKLVKEKICITYLFRSTLKQFVMLFMVSCISMSVSYFDRLFIYPLLSANDSTLYYIATLIGKTASLALSPAASVLLAYLVKMDSINKKLFKKMTYIILTVLVPTYFVYYYGNFVLLPILYPNQLNDVMPYLQVTALIAIFETVKLVYNPILLRFTDMKTVLVLNIINVSMYLILGIIFVNQWQLIGYCYAILITNIVIAILYISISYYKIIVNRKKMEG